MQHFLVRPRLTAINKIGCVLKTCPPQAENFGISRRQSIDFYCKKHNFNIILHLKIPKISGLRPAESNLLHKNTPLVSDRGETRGGILMGGGILKWNTPDTLSRDSWNS